MIESWNKRVDNLALQKEILELKAEIESKEKEIMFLNMEISSLSNDDNS